MLTYEEVVEIIKQRVHEISLLGKLIGYENILDKSKFHEPIMAEILGHEAFKKISAGKNSDKYGADAHDRTSGKMAEYKSMTLKDKQIPNLLRKPKGKKGLEYVAFTVFGIYNGAYTLEAIEAYDKHDHYFSVFHEEKCILIIKPDHNYVIGTLVKNYEERQAKSNKGTSNLNTVKIDLANEFLYEVVYRDDEWYKKHGGT